MLCGTPVVAMRVGAVPEIIDEGVTGYSAQSTEEFREHVLRSFSLDRAAVRTRAESRFSPARTARQYVELYERLVLRNQDRAGKDRKRSRTRQRTELEWQP